MKTYKSKKYYKAINWIVSNDEPEEFNKEAITNLTSVQLVSDLFRIKEEVVADDILQRRIADYKLANFVID